MKLKKISMIALGIMLSLSMVACSNNTENLEEENSTAEVVETEQTDIVVGTSVAVVEILDKLGVKMAGVPTSSYELPESAKDATKVGNPMSPDMEIIKALSPTAVISTDTLGKDYEDLFVSNNIPSIFVNLDSLKGLKETIKSLGERFNKTEKADELLKELENKEEALGDLAEGKDKKKVMIAFAAPGGVSMLATEESYVGNLVKIAGGENIISDKTGPFVSYNKEALSQMDPDILLVMTHALPEQTQKEFQNTLNTDTSWKNINAVKEGNVVYLDSSYFGMSANLKVTESLDKLSEIIYGSK